MFPRCEIKKYLIFCFSDCLSLSFASGLASHLLIRLGRPGTRERERRHKRSRSGEATITFNSLHKTSTHSHTHHVHGNSRLKELTTHRERDNFAPESLKSGLCSY